MTSDRSGYTIFVLLLTGLVLMAFLFDVGVRHWLRRRPNEQLEQGSGMRTVIWSMRLRHVLIGALILALVASVGHTTHDRWLILGATSVVVLPLVGVMLWFNAEISRLLRRRAR